MSERDRDRVRAAVTALARQHYFEEGHSLQDARLARQLFEGTRALHGLDDACADLLEYAAILHDIGYEYGYPQHHKHALRMILEADIPGLSEREKRIVAHTARYHRGPQPDPRKHRRFAQLPEKDREIVRRLGAILRFADGLDRTHTFAVHDLHCQLEGHQLIVTLEPATGNEVERQIGRKKARFFEAVFDVTVILR